MSDLQVPEHAYKRRITLLELEMNQIDERKELVRVFALSLPSHTHRSFSDGRQEAQGERKDSRDHRQARRRTREAEGTRRTRPCSTRHRTRVLVQQS